MSEELTAQERAFVAELVQGVTRTEAYRKAFNCSAMSQDAVRKAAQRLSRRDYILSAVDRAKDAAGKVQLVDDVPPVLARQAFLARLLQEANAAQRPADRLRALEIYGRFAYGTEPLVQVNTAVQVGISAADVLAAVEPPVLG